MCRNGIQIGLPRQGRDHGKGGPSPPGFPLGIHHGGGEAWIDFGELHHVLLSEFIPVGKNAGLATAC